MADLLVDFEQSLFDLAGNALGMNGLEMTLGKLAIEAVSVAAKNEPDMTEQAKLAHYELLKKIDNGVKTHTPVQITEEEVPLLRKAINRTVDILTFGRVHDILEASPRA